jgi:hypothetical protein
MSNTNLTQITPLVAINGTEVLYVIQYDSLTQTWIDYTCTSGQIANFFAGITTSTPSMRQIKAAMADLGYMLQVSQEVPSDVTDSDNIAWTAAFRMSKGDIFVTGFLVSLLGQSAVDAIWAIAPTFPV